MTTNLPAHDLARSSIVLPRSVASVLLALALAIVSARAESADGTADPKIYNLFQGTDIALKTKDGTYPVCDISDGSWVVRENGQVVVIDAKDGPTSLKVHTGLRLTRGSASISDLKKEPDYTPENDPYTKFTRATNQAAADSAQSEFAANQANAQMTIAMVQAAQSSASNPGSAQAAAGGSAPAGSSSSQIQAQQAVNAASAAVSAAGAAAGASPGIALGVGSNMDTESYDALDISFNVSAPKQLDRPYFVIMCRYHERNGPPGSFREWIDARALGPVGPKPTKVHYLARGFTPGYELLSFELHLYNQGSEVGTNLSQKRVEYTLDEAFDFYRKIYMNSHKSDTLPAVPAMGNLPPDLPSKIEQGQLTRVLFVQVSKDGLGIGTYSDEACSKKIDDPYIKYVIGEIRFEPALKNGQPVDGIATLRLDHLAM